MQNQLMQELGMLAIQIKQDGDALKQKKKRYQSLSDQVALLQAMDKDGYTIAGPEKAESPGDNNTQ